MKTTLTILFATTLLAGTGLAQRQAPTHDMSRAQAFFRGGDRDSDGKLSQAETRALGVSHVLVRKHDANGDGFIDKSEFYVAYRSMVQAQGESVGGDLDNEVTRILAARKAAKEKADAEARAKHAERLKQAELQKVEEARKAAAARKAEAARKAAEARKKAGETRPEGQRPQKERRPTPAPQRRGSGRVGG